MKHKLLIMMVLCVLAGAYAVSQAKVAYTSVVDMTALGFTNPLVLIGEQELSNSNSPKWFVDSVTNTTWFVSVTNGITTNSWEPSDSEIRYWAESGRICRVMKHQWGPGSGDMAYALWTQPVRKCNLCGKTETLVQEWR